MHSTKYLWRYHVVGTDPQRPLPALRPPAPASAPLRASRVASRQSVLSFSAGALGERTSILFLRRHRRRRRRGTLLGSWILFICVPFLYLFILVRHPARELDRTSSCILLLLLLLLPRYEIVGAYLPAYFTSLPARERNLTDRLFSLPLDRSDQIPVHLSQQRIYPIQQTTTRQMPPRKATSTTPAEADEPQQTAMATATATEQQIKAQAEGGVSVEVCLCYFSLVASHSAVGTCLGCV